MALVKVRMRVDPLAVKLTDQLFEIDPFNGLFRSEALQELDRAVKTADGLRGIIENDIEIIAELMQDNDTLIRENNELIAAIRKYDPNFGYNGNKTVN